MFLIFKKFVNIFVSAALMLLLQISVLAQDHNHSHGPGTPPHDHSAPGHTHAPAANAATSGQNSQTEQHSSGEAKKAPDISGMIMNHIGDANEFHLWGHTSISLPCLVYHFNHGFEFFSSGVFIHGHNSYNGYVMQHGRLYFVNDPSFQKAGSVEVHVIDEKGKKHVIANNVKYNDVDRSSFIDFSITKVVFTMLLATLLMILIFTSIARAYKTNHVPKGLASFFEPIIEFVRDNIVKPNIGKNYEKYMPLMLTMFFFIWISNMLGLIPFYPGGGNVMGNISVAFTLAFFVFLIINLSGKKAYWGHIFNPPGMPGWVKAILVPIEILSIFIKPFALMIRLFANIVAGHIIILSFVGIIFILHHIGGPIAGWGTGLISAIFLLFMNALELLVAALQAYIFTMLAAVFIGQALEEHDHHGEEQQHAH